MVITFRDDFRQQVIPYLQELGFEVCVPPHRQDVLPMVAEQQPLMVLLDLYVTNPNGLEVLGDLRAHGYKGKVTCLTRLGGRRQQIKGIFLVQRVKPKVS